MTMKKRRNTVESPKPAPLFKLIIAPYCLLLGTVVLHLHQARKMPVATSTTVEVAAPKLFRDSNDNVKICGITVMLGPYEKSVKEPTSPLDPSYPLFLVTDRDDLIKETASEWTKVPLDHSLWKDDCLRDEFVNAPNNPCNQTYDFNIAKFYKEQPYRVPEIINAGCNVIVWMDGTIRIKDKSFMGHMKERAERGQNLVVSVHRPARKGLLSAEVESSVGNKKYQGKGGAHFGPFQNISRQYRQYVSEGFTERWFEQETWWPDVKGVAPDLYGVFVTCMVLFDLRKQTTKTFLDCWWKENILHSTQDQVSFPYCSWKHKIPIHALPDAEFQGNFERNTYFDKLGHGQ